MPKMKTNRSASKRFRVTPTGKLLVLSRGLRHNLEHKSGKRKRALDGVVSLGKSAHKTALRQLGKR